MLMISLVSIVFAFTSFASVQWAGLTDVQYLVKLGFAKCEKGVIRLFCNLLIVGALLKGMDVSIVLFFQVTHSLT